jgi:hypothetical protein
LPGGSRGLGDVYKRQGGVSTMFEVISMEAKEFDEELNEVGVNLVTAKQCILV